MRKNILTIIFVVAIVIVGFVWYNFARPTREEEKTESEYHEFLVQVSAAREIEKTEIDTSILNDPFFKSLESAPETTIPPSNPGKKNPFVPL